MRGAGFDPRSVNTQKFNWFCIPSFPLVNGDEVEDFVVSDAVYGESQTDGHGGRIDLVWDHVPPASVGGPASLLKSLRAAVEQWTSLHSGSGSLI